MLTLAPFTFCANNVPGTDPIRAMDMARRCGFHTIELSAIDGISEQIVAERVSPEYVMQIERELQKRVDKNSKHKYGLTLNRISCLLSYHMRVEEKRDFSQSGGKTQNKRENSG